jgi:hypothetical protein
MRMKSKYRGSCQTCGVFWKPGVLIDWKPGEGAKCISCAEGKGIGEMSEQRIRGFAAAVEMAMEAHDEMALLDVKQRVENETGIPPGLKIDMGFEEALAVIKDTVAAGRAEQEAAAEEALASIQETAVAVAEPMVTGELVMVDDDGVQIAQIVDDPTDPQDMPLPEGAEVHESTPKPKGGLVISEGDDDGSERKRLEDLLGDW